MVEYPNKEQILNLSEVEEIYPNCRVLLKDVDMSDISNVKGTVYAISHSTESFDELCDIYDRLFDDGNNTIIAGV